MTEGKGFEPTVFSDEENEYIIQIANLSRRLLQAKNRIHELTEQIRGTTTILYILSKGEPIIITDEELRNVPRDVVVWRWDNLVDSTHHFSFEKADS